MCSNVTARSSGHQVLFYGEEKYTLLSTRTEVGRHIQKYQILHACLHGRGWVG